MSKGVMMPLGVKMAEESSGGGAVCSAGETLCWEEISVCSCPSCLCILLFESRKKCKVIVESDIGRDRCMKDWKTCLPCGGDPLVGQSRHSLQRLTVFGAGFVDVNEDKRF